MRSYPIKKNHIGSAVRDILRYRQTDRYPGTFIRSLILGEIKHREGGDNELFIALVPKVLQ